MDHMFLFGLAILAILGAGFIVGFLVGRSRQRLLQREIAQLQLALQRSQSEEQQREEAFQRSQQDLQRSREELQRNQQDFLRSQEESGQYRTQVTQHFRQTADLLQTLTLNYRAMYDHLAVGAAALCDGQVKTLTAETLRERLLAPPNEETAAEGVAMPQPPATIPDAEQPPALSSQDTSITDTHRG
jgi:uncharacterized membrane-anchored protein YhcB (DUF1043 family)